MTISAGGPTEAPPATAGFEVTAQQRRYFETFGFIRFDGLFADDVADITAAFDQVVSESGPAEDVDDATRLESDLEGYGAAFEDRARLEIHDDVHFGKRRIIVPFVIGKHERLSALTSDERFTTVARALVGPGYEVVGSDGNVFFCDTSWHFDFYGAPIDQLYVKFFLYLDPVDADHGALRVIPGTNYWNTPYAEELRGSLADWRAIEDTLGVPGDQIPYWPIDSRPGDLLVAYYRTLHATYGGDTGRRLIAINLRGET